MRHVTGRDYYYMRFRGLNNLGDRFTHFGVSLIARFCAMRFGDSVVARVEAGEVVVASVLRCQLHGFAGLFLIGFLWAAVGGAGTALPAVAHLLRARRGASAGA